MHVRTIASFGVLVLFPVLLSGEISQGAVVRTVRVAPDNKSAIVDVSNNSKKDISAYAIAYEITFPDGHRDKGERVVEYLQSIISAQQRLGAKWAGEGVFHPGETRNESFAFTKTPISGMNATVDVVIYTDDTAEIANQEAFNLLMSDRLATARADDIAAGILQTALTDTNDVHPLETARTKLQQVLTSGSISSLPAKASLQTLVENLQRIGETGKKNGWSVERVRESMKRMVAEKSSGKAVTLQHSQLRGRQ